MGEIELGQQALSTAIGAGAGGGIVLWFAKGMATRLIAQYDKKHEAHEAASMAMLVKLTSVETSLSFIKELTMSVSGVRELIDSLRKDVNNIGNKMRTRDEAFSERLERLEDSQRRRSEE